MSNLYRGPSKDASCQVSIQFAKRPQRRTLKKINQSETRIVLWRPCLLTDQDETNNLYRGPAIDASYQVSVHFAKQLQRRFLEIDQPETRIACGGHACYRIETK